MALSQNAVLKLYNSVIEDVISGVRDTFLDEGVDEQVLLELKQIWESKLQASKAVEPIPDPIENPVPPPLAQKLGSRVQHVLQPTAVTQQATTTHTMGASNFQSSAPSAPATHVVQSVHAPTTTAPPPPAPLPTPLPTAGQTTTILADPSRLIPIQITLPAQQGTNGGPRSINMQVPLSVLQGNQLQALLTGPVIAATLSLPTEVAASVLQQHINATLQHNAANTVQQYQTATATTTSNAQQSFHPGATSGQSGILQQLDGPADTSDEDDDDDDNDDDDDDDNDDKDDDDNEDENEYGGPEEEPLNSGDDVSDEDPTDLFDTDNVVVCQYDKITRSRNKWKFYLKDGIMNLNGKDYVFQKSNGDAEW